MKAALVTGPGQLVVGDVNEPDPADRALVAVTSVGVCGTDVKILAGSIPVAYPRIIGHEIVGTVVKAGASSLFPVGMTVLVDPVGACGHCAACRGERAHLCMEGGLMGRDVDGGLAEYIAVDEHRLHPVPADLNSAEAPVLQPLGTCIHSQYGFPVLPDHVAVVSGLGVAGLLHLELLVARGVRTIVAVSRSESRRELARTLGATVSASPEEAGDVLAGVSGGRGADLVIESAGTVSALGRAIDMAGPGATILSFGILTQVHLEEFPLYSLYHKELTIQGSRAALPADYDRAIQIVDTGGVRLGPLLSHSFPIGDAGAAFDRVLHRDDQVLKVTLEVGRRG